MSVRQILGRKLVRRLMFALLLSALLTGVVSAWIYHTANQRAAHTQLTSAYEHYASVISGLEQHWGREAFNFKIRLESLHFLENAAQHKDLLLANLTAQGGSLEFPSLRIEDAKGDLILTYEYIGHKIPKVRFLTGQESAWAMDPVHGQLYMVFRQFIWLGSENGYLLLFKPMDHALLNQYSYPFTRISLWWNGKPVASSEGDDGLAMASIAYEREKTNKSLPPSRLPWSITDPDNAPLIFIESTSPPLLTIRDLAGPLAVSLVAFALATWAILSALGMRPLQRRMITGQSAANEESSGLKQ
jgi:hypothetical protein